MHVRRLVVLTGAVVLAASVAQAQTQVPPPQVPAQAAAPPSQYGPSANDWTGVYAGGNLGGVSTSFSGPVSLASFVVAGTTHPAESVALSPMSGGSGIIGLQVGYAGRLSPSLIGALEFQLSHASPTIAVAAGSQATSTANFAAADTFDVKAGAMSSLRARVGTAMAPDLFVYGTLGVAFTSVTADGAFPANGSLPASSGTDTHTMKGLTIGAGAEYAPFKQGNLRALSIGAEFRHAALGTVSFNLGSVNVQPAPTTQPAIGTISVSSNEFDVRINVRFGAWR